MNRSLLVGTRKGLFLYSASGSALRLVRQSFLGAQVPNVGYDARTGVLLAALNHGHFGAKIHRSTDTGQTWDELPPPTYPEKPDDVPDIIDPMRKVPIPWSLELIWALEPSADGRFRCGTIPGGLFVSSDRGESWELVRELWDVPARQHWFGGGYDYPGIHSICLHPDDPKTIRVGVSCGGVWTSRDGGQSWDTQCSGMRAAYVPPELAEDPNVQDPHRMVQSPSSPDHFWIQHHNGIFHSTDGCESWSECQDVQPSTFGFTVVVHPKDANTAWFVPGISDEVRCPVDGRFVVTRTTDGGASFEQLSAGLPGENAYDLVYRHALDVDNNGESLAMGSTTGDLWVSHDGGESWDIVNHHLPPIFCVKWITHA